MGQPPVLRFGVLTLELVTALHIGAGRSGMLARGHGFVPGHVLAYALAAALGKARGGSYQDFEAGLEEVRAGLRCGPLFPLAGDSVLLPRRDREAIEAGFLQAVNHVALDPRSCSAVDGALYEVESIASRVLHGSRRGLPVRLRGGIWFGGESLAGAPLRDWLGRCVLGGEGKAGLGRVRVSEWRTDAADYAGLGRVDGGGLHLRRGEVLPGPALDGVEGVALEPWLGRLYDRQRGFGRRFSAAALVRMDGLCVADGCFLPVAGEEGAGCWMPV